jgi:hypothetical protein
VWVATQKGKIDRARSVRRIPVEDRWGEDCVKWVKNVPWNRYPGAEDADGEVPEGVVAEGRQVVEGDWSGGVIIKVKEKAPREFCIKKDDAEFSRSFLFHFDNDSPTPVPLHHLPTLRHYPFWHFAICIFCPRVPIPRNVLHPLHTVLPPPILHRNPPH